MREGGRSSSVVPPMEPPSSPPPQKKKRGGRLRSSRASPRTPHMVDPASNHGPNVSGWGSACRAAAARRQSHKRKPYNWPPRRACGDRLDHHVAGVAPCRIGGGPRATRVCRAAPDESGRPLQTFKIARLSREASLRSPASFFVPGGGRTRSEDPILIDSLAQFDRRSTARSKSTIQRARNETGSRGVGPDGCGPFTRHTRAHTIPRPTIKTVELGLCLFWDFFLLPLSPSSSVPYRSSSARLPARGLHIHPDSTHR